MNTTLKIAYMGTPDFAVPALKALHESAHEITCVYTQPPRPKGRGHKVQPSSVHAFAQDNNIPVFHPKTLKTTEAQQEFAAQNVDIAIVAAYGLILPKAILDAPKYGCINIHASLLPRWRGASPIQHAIWKGDDVSGVTLMQMDEGLDTGPEISKREVPISENMTAQELHDALSDLGGDMIVEAIDKLAKIGQIESKSQDNSQSTYAPMLKKEDGKIDWTQTAIEIDQQIRALNPWPGTYSGNNDNRLKITAAELPKQIENHETYRPVGMLLNKSGDVVCAGETVLRIKTVQPAGKKPMDIASAINGGYLTIGEELPQ